MGKSTGKSVIDSVLFFAAVEAIYTWPGEDPVPLATTKFSGKTTWIKTYARLVGPKAAEGQQDLGELFDEFERLNYLYF